MSTKSWKVGSRVSWRWLGRIIEGKVVERHSEKIQKMIKGKLITRNGSIENPAYLVESTAGNLALKLGSELAALPKPKKSSLTPKMFSDEP